MGWGSLRSAAALALAWAIPARADDERPHIVLAVVDDLGWSDVGYQGSGDLGGATPQLDALAAEGVAFEALYGAAECTPSRAMLLTGRHAVALGLQDSVIHGTEPRGLDLTVATLADKLGARGYGTSAVGKWHLGFHTPKYLPRRRGFDSFFGILTGGGDHFSHSTTESFSVRGNLTSSTTHGATGRNLWEDDGPLGADAFASYDGVHTTALYAERALKIVDAKFSSKDPHFLYLAYQAVHGPVQADAATYAAGSVCGGVAKRAAAAAPRGRRRPPTAPLLDGCGGDATEDDAGDARCGGRFKLVVENSVGDAVLYRAGRAYLAAADLAAADFDAALDGRRSALFPEPIYHLFDVDADPSETADLHNASRAGAFDDVLARLVAICDGVDAAGTTDVWLDDGPLASPDFFGGAWMPWRDENDFPYATYAILPGR
ncbi:sulfuric ester hydrolase [Aureococcus anophagefferens]|nr:sulfuric ester hydrolase [Aureococcus anophagefferens]